MKWYKFDCLENFTIWHNAIKKQLNLPLPSRNSAGKIVDGIITNSYTEPFIINENDIRVYINDDFAEGLELSESPFVDLRSINAQTL